MTSMTILYVSDQETTRVFFETVLQRTPTLNVPGMTEFTLDDGTRIGFMPEVGIRSLLGLLAAPEPQPFSNLHAELYISVENADAFHQRALKNGARELRPLATMSWGDRVAYSITPDGHVLAFAEMQTEA